MKEIRIEIFSKNLRDARLKRGYTQESLAEAIESTHATVNRWENGVSKPNFLDFYKLMSVLGTNFEQLSGLERLPAIEPLPKMSLVDALDLIAQETGIVIKLPKTKNTEKIPGDITGALESADEADLRSIRNILGLPIPKISKKTS